MKPTENADASALRRLDELVAEGEALIEARRNPADAGKMFPDFGQAYRDWHVAGKDLIAELSSPSAAKDWSAAWCRAMCHLDQDAAACLKAHERQQAMLVKLRGRFGAELASRADATQPDSRRLTNEKLLQDLIRLTKPLRKKTITMFDYKRKGQFSADTFITRFGSWNNALAAAGLEVTKLHNIPTPELLENLARVAQKLGRQPKQSDMVKPLSQFSYYPYQCRFGGWRLALKALDAWTRDGTLPAKAGARPKTPRAAGARLRHAVFQRDCFKCTICGQSPATDPSIKLVLDHIIPRIRGGPTIYENLRTLCDKCNVGKSDG